MSNKNTNIHEKAENYFWFSDPYLTLLSMFLMSADQNSYFTIIGLCKKIQV